MADTTMNMPMIDLSATMRDLLDQHKALQQYIENVGEARKRLKEIERTLVYLNSVTSQPVTIPGRGKKDTHQGTKKATHQGTRTKRVDILWEWNTRKGLFQCMVPGCKCTAATSSAMGGHFHKKHPAEYDQNTLTPK